jgi:hypothetical protein
MCPQIFDIGIFLQSCMHAQMYYPQIFPPQDLPVHHVVSHAIH